MKLGFIGTGNMAGAIMGGIIKKGIIPAEEIIGSDIMETGRNHVKELYGIQVTADNKEVAEKADILVLSVKPQFYAETIQEIRESVREDQMVITIAPGKTLAWLEEQFGKPVRIVRTMPNTPALVGEGMTAACPNQYVTEKDKAYALKLLGAFGKVEVVPEHCSSAIRWTSWLTRWALPVLPRTPSLLPWSATMSCTTSRTTRISASPLTA